MKIDTRFKKSQLNQDIWILLLYGEKREGYFVEVGSTTGTNLSNTYLLEKGYDWGGICIDANPNDTEELRKNRDCIVLDSCISSKSGEEVSFLVQSCYSGIEMYTEKKDYPNGDGNVDYEKTITLTTVTLDQVLRENNAPLFIEYISIDTEGSELEVLKGIDFSSFTIGAFTIEHNDNEIQKEEIQNFLQSKGYEKFVQVHWEDWYVLSDLYKHII
tara:strand:- start:12111 stop:12758 length:648 start_codon:yes stop_codon:yes gene_type:complete